MNRTHISFGALGVFLVLAIGSVPDTGSSGGDVGEDAIDELKGSVCTGDDPFKLPAEDGIVWGALAGRAGDPVAGLLYGQDNEQWAGEIEKQQGWVDGSALKAAATEAAGQACNYSMECDGTTCVSQESILNTQWILEFRPDITDTDWVLVGYFVGSYDSDDAARTASVDASIASWKAELISTLGVPAVPGE